MLTRWSNLIRGEGWCQDPCPMQEANLNLPPRSSTRSRMFCRPAPSGVPAGSKPPTVVSDADGQRSLVMAQSERDPGADAGVFAAF